jgi:hypothetical protein
MLAVYPKLLWRRKGSQRHRACFSDRVEFDRSRAFCRKLLPFLWLTPVTDTDEIYYCIDVRTGSGSARGRWRD